MTGNELLKKATTILGLLNNAGEIANDAGDFSVRALALINLLLAENAVLDSRIRKTEHKVLAIDSLDDALELTEIVAQSVMPYGLASLLIMGEDDSLYLELRRAYAEARSNALRFGKAKIHGISEVYE